MNALTEKLRGAVEAVLILLMSAMVALTFADVIGRRIFGKPIFGAHDITEHLMALMVFTGLPLVTLAAMHLKVDLFEKLFLHPRMKWWLAGSSLLTALVFAIMSWTLLKKSIDAGTYLEVSQGLNLPRMPLYAYMAGCAALSALAAAYTAFAAPISVSYHQEEVL